MRAAERGRIQTLSRRVHVLSGRPALAGIPGREAMRGRQVADLSHDLARTVRLRVSSRERRIIQWRQRLEACALGRRLALIRTRLVGVDGRLGSAVARRRHHADRRLRESAGRLETLSPLAVLARGYAVCWTEDRSKAIRNAAETGVGDHVLVTLAQGELDCEVRDKKDTSYARHIDQGLRDRDR
jgi:exodeoxyribonuclease VII large subunit